jgi:hypothetical protein
MSTLNTEQSKVIHRLLHSHPFLRSGRSVLTYRRNGLFGMLWHLKDKFELAQPKECDSFYNFYANPDSFGNIGCEQLRNELVAALSKFHQENPNLNMRYQVILDGLLNKKATSEDKAIDTMITKAEELKASQIQTMTNQEAIEFTQCKNRVFLSYLMRDAGFISTPGNRAWKRNP